MNAPPIAKRLGHPHAAAGENCVLQLPDGRLLGYAEYGDPQGPPVIALHGTPGARLMFRPADAPARSMGLRVIAPDRPGCGLSSPLRSRTVAGFASDIAMLAGALGLERFALAAVSGGAPYAVACASLLNERVTKLALVSPMGPLAEPELSSRQSGWRARGMQVLGAVPLLTGGSFAVFRLGLRYAPERVIGVMAAAAAPADRPILRQPDVSKALSDALYEGLSSRGRGAVQDVSLFVRPWNVDFSQITAPAYLWYGTDDRSAPPVAAAYLGSALPNCRTIELDGAGHCWVFANLETVLGVLKD